VQPITSQPNSYLFIYVEIIFEPCMLISVNFYVKIQGKIINITNTIILYFHYYSCFILNTNNITPTSLSHFIIILQVRMIFLYFNLFYYLQYLIFILHLYFLKPSSVITHIKKTEYVHMCLMFIVRSTTITTYTYEYTSLIIVFNRLF